MKHNYSSSMKQNISNLQINAATLSTRKPNARSVVFVSPRNEPKAIKALSGKKEDDNSTPASKKDVKEKQKSLEDVSQEETSSPLSFTNVAFPRGFTPSQCVLLASRQRISNYLYYKTNDREENKEGWQGSKLTNFKPRGSYSEIDSAKTCDSKNILRNLNGLKETKSPGHRKLRHGKESSTREKTGLTGHLKWKSKDEIASYLAAHAHARLLWVQEFEDANNVKSERENELSAGRKVNEIKRFPPRPPLYLFDEDSMKTG